MQISRNDFVYNFSRNIVNGPWISTLELKICKLGHLCEVLFVRSTNSTKFCSFVLQTLRSSVRSFFKLYEVLFVRSSNSTKFC